MRKKKAEISKEEVKKEDLFEVKYMTRWQLVWRALRKHKLGLLSLWVLAIMYLMAIFADFLAPVDPYAQVQNNGFAPPSDVHWTDEDGKFSFPYIYQWSVERDPSTFRTSFVEATTVEKITLIDNNNDEKTYNDDENALGIWFAIEERRYAADSEGNRAYLGNPEYINTQTLKLNEMEIFENPIILDETSKNALGSITPSRYRTLNDIGEPVSIFREKTLKRVFIQNEKELDDVIKESIAMYNEFLDEGEDAELIQEFLGEIGISPTLVKVIEKPKILEYTTRKYPLKFFVSSWEYNLLGFIPVNIHLFGTELPARYLPFGADKYGRGLLSRIFFGSRISMTIGLFGIAITFSLGLFIGGAAGFYGGAADEVLMRVTEILMSIPGFYLLISLRSVLPTGLPSTITYLMIIIILSLIGWTGMSRVIRGMVLSLKSREYVQAAIAMGYPDNRVIMRHIIPNTATYIIVAATLSIPSYIVGEAGLSFLGLGIQEPSASWGLMLSQAQNIKVMTEAPWLLIPGIFIFVVVMAFNLLGDALRDALDPRSLGY